MYRHFFKRFFDIIMSLLILIISSPFLLIIAIAIKLDSKGPVVFKQERLGKNGKVFKIYKFRSMCVGAEKTGSGVYSDKNDAIVARLLAEKKYYGDLAPQSNLFDKYNI